MPQQFQKHYTRDEARALLPSVREWLERIAKLRAELDACEQRIEGLRTHQSDLGGGAVNKQVRLISGIKQVLNEFHVREIQIKDLDRGLIDFPAYVGGKEVFLCWERGEEDVEFWHDLDAGYAGREPLDQ